MVSVIATNIIFALRRLMPISNLKCLNFKVVFLFFHSSKKFIRICSTVFVVAENVNFYALNSGHGKNHVYMD